MSEEKSQEKVTIEEHAERNAAPAHPAEGVPAQAAQQGVQPKYVLEDDGHTGYLDGQVSRFSIRRTGGEFLAWIVADPHIDDGEAIAREIIHALNAADPTTQGLDAQLLDFVNDKRVALTPEYEGPWRAEVFADEDAPVVTAEGGTVRDAIAAALAAQAKQGGV